MRNRVKYIVLLAAAAFLIVGIQHGDTQVVLQKAVNICLECIGVG